MPSLWYSRRSRLWSLKCPHTKGKENTGSWVHPNLQCWWLTLCFWHISDFPHTSVHPPVFENKRLLLLFTLSSKWEMAIVSGPFSIGKKKIHSKLSPMPCLWFTSSSSFASNTQEDSTRLNLITSVQSWVLALRNAKGKEYYSSRRGKEFTSFLQAEVKFCVTQHIDILDDLSLFCFLIYLSWPVWFSHQNSFISTVIMHRRW